MFVALYVTSDAHGHLRALDEALELAGLGKDDELYVLGDLIDRGPDPLGVINLVRGLKNAHVLRGNHEELMLDAIEAAGAPVDGHFDVSAMGNDTFGAWLGWMQNGGGTTAEQLEGLDESSYHELMVWVRSLPLYAVVEAGGRTYGLCHAGIDPKAAHAWRYFNPDANLTKVFALQQLFAAQNPEDLLWVREDFWANPTGLIDADGMGPVIVAGHTPTPNLPYILDDEHLVCQDSEGLSQVVKLGATEATGGVYDRINIDCAAAIGHPIGQIGVMRLDDGALFYAPIKEGE